MTTETLNKEQVYDEQISPLMAQIINICMERNIGMVATFHIPTDADPTLRCTTALVDLPKGMGNKVDLALTTLLKMSRAD